MGHKSCLMLIDFCEAKTVQFYPYWADLMHLCLRQCDAKLDSECPYVATRSHHLTSFNMAPANVKLNPAGVVIFTVGLILSLFYLFGLPDFFRSEKRVSMRELLAVSIQLAERGGERVKSIHDGNDLHESVKGKTLEGKKEMLTSGDLESHKAIYYGFQKMYPSMKVS